MSNKKDLQALAENLVEEFYETQGAGVLKNLNKRTYGNLISGREDVLNSIRESLSEYTDEEGQEIGEEEKGEILHLVDREIWGYGIIDDLIHDKSISDIKIHNAENIRIKRNGKREGSDITFPSEGAYKSFVTRLLERNKVNLGTANAIQTFTDADQEDFILRLAVIGGLLIVGGSPLVVIRKIPKNKYSLSELSDLGMFGKTGRKGSLKVHFQERFFPEGNEDLDSLFSQMIESRGILFTGKGASGKTTLMNACIEKIPESDSVMICQENAELFDLHHPDIIAAHVMVNGGDSKVSYNLVPKILIKRIKLPRSTIGDEIKKEKVTPNGSPALVNPINKGIDEQEQNGVTVPSKAAIQFADTPLNLPMIFLLLSGGK